MNRIWRRYKPFISTGIQGLITYRVDFILYRIGDVIGAFVAFYLWKAVFDSSSQSLIQGFQLSDMILYIIMSFVTNLLTRTDSSILSSVNRLADFVIENSEDIDDQAK